MGTLGDVRTECGRVVAALREIVAQYDAAPDGPLGKGFTNGPFLRARDLLAEIAGKRGLCIYGTPELMDASDAENASFRLGSAIAFDEVATMADEALAALTSETPKEER